MALKDEADKLKAEAQILATHFNLTPEQLAPVTEAVAAFNALWAAPTFVEPDVLEAAANNINDAIEDVCLANKITDMQIEAFLPKTTLKRLVIEHNHGCYVLEDVSVIPDPEHANCRSVKGTIVDGGVTNRLLGATSFTPDPKGELKEVDIWDRHLFCTDKEADHWRVSIVVCG